MRLTRTSQLKPAKMITLRQSFLSGALLLACADQCPFAVPSLSIQGQLINPANGHTYLLAQNTSWVHGEIEAVKRGGHLVTINDAAEQNWLYTRFSRFN